MKAVGLSPEQVVVLALLCLNTVQDLRKREILALPTVAAAAAGFFWVFLRMRQPVPQILAGGIPGLAVMLAAALSEGEIGGGDGLVLLAAGIWLGLPSAMLFLADALLPAAAYALAERIRSRNRKVWKKRIPFLPFLLGGYLLWLLFPGIP